MVCIILHVLLCNSMLILTLLAETSSTTLTDTAADSTTKTSILLEAQKTLGQIKFD